MINYNEKEVFQNNLTILKIQIVPILALSQFNKLFIVHREYRKCLALNDLN